MIYPGILHKFQENFKGVEKFDDDEKIKDIIFTIVTSATNISPTQILGNVRWREIVIARQLIHYYLKKFTTFPLKTIGRFTNNNHATVLHSVKTIKNDVENNLTLNRKVKRIETEIINTIQREIL